MLKVGKLGYIGTYSLLLLVVYPNAQPNWRKMASDCFGFGGFWYISLCEYVTFHQPIYLLST